VYVLAGPSAETGQERVYVGEGDPVRPRLEQHAARKDFWTQAFVFTSEGQNLNKAHVQYLEARLVELAGEAKRCELDNGNQPQRPSLSEPDQAEVETFLAEMLLCLEVLAIVTIANTSSDDLSVLCSPIPRHASSQHGIVPEALACTDCERRALMFADTCVIVRSALTLPSLLTIPGEP
jgi:hypothetical protein